MVKSLPHSQFLRVKKIVEDPSTDNLRLHELPNKFHTQGYPKNLISTHLKRVIDLEQKDLLEFRVDGDKTSRLTFVSVYSEASNQIRDVIK